MLDSERSGGFDICFCFCFCIGIWIIFNALSINEKWLAILNRLKKKKKKKQTS